VESAGLRGVVFYDAATSSPRARTFQEQPARRTCRWDCSTASGWDCAGSRRSGRCASDRVPVTRRDIDEPYLFEFTIGNFF